MANAETVEKRKRARAYMEHARDCQIRRRLVNCQSEKVHESLETLKKLLGKRAETHEATRKTRGLLGLFVREIRECVETVGEATEALSHLRPKYRLVIKARYLDGMKWDSIEQALIYSKSRLIQLHNEGLAELYNHIPEAWQTLED